MKTQADVYERITEAIIEAIEAGCQKYRMPWNAIAVMPANAATRRRYRGINILALWAAAIKQADKTNLWATYQQWADLGAQVRKGEKSTAVVFWKFSDGEERETGDESADDATGTRKRCFARAYNVFNANQVEGFRLPDVAELPEAERIDGADRFFQNTGAKIIEAGARACYNPTSDEIHMPPFSLFQKADYFYSTLAHEIVHWSGHPSRCDRELSGRFGSESYAAEELIAELGSAFLAADLQLESEPRTDHAPYVANWFQVLKNDKRAIFTAAGKAQQAVDWLLQQNAKEQAA